MRVMSGPQPSPQPPPEADRDEADGDWWDDDAPDPGPLTYEAVADGIPDDPDPARMPSAAPTTTIVITRAALVQLLSVAAFEGYELCSWDVQRALTATGKPESPCS